jgi:hypothetical protein
MRQLNGVYTQRFNRRNGRTGHVFEGRFKAVLVQKDRHLLSVSRYVVLNPVRAGLVTRPEEWIWSSLPAILGTTEAPSWLCRDEILGYFGSDPIEATRRYHRFVLEGIEEPGPWAGLRQQLNLQDHPRPGRKATTQSIDSREIPRSQRRPLARPLQYYLKTCPTRDEAMARAYLTGVYTMQEIGRFFGVHYMTVSRAVRQFEQRARRHRGTAGGGATEVRDVPGVESGALDGPAENPDHKSGELVQQ